VNDTASLLDDYRARLRAASCDLPPPVRDELLDDVEAHLAELRATSPSREATLAALERLGSPEQVAAAATVELGSAPPPPAGATPAWTPPPVPTRRSIRALDVTAVVLLLIGGLVLPVVGWVVGVVLLWASGTWNWREKLLGTLVFPGGLLTPFLFAFLPGQSCSSGFTTDDQGNVIETFDEVCEGFAFAPWLGITLLGRPGRRSGGGRRAAAAPCDGPGACRRGRQRHAAGLTAGPTAGQAAGQMAPISASAARHLSWSRASGMGLRSV
jgi:hypothetical protein